MIPRVRLGRTGLEVTRIALGGFPFGAVNRARGWDPFTPQGRATAIATVRAALEAGINTIDTAPAYGHGHSESIIALNETEPFCPILPNSAQFCPILPDSARFCPILPNSAQFCPILNG